MIHQSVHQAYKKPINQLIYQVIHQSNKRTNKESINHSINQKQLCVVYRSDKGHLVILGSGSVGGWMTGKSNPRPECFLAAWAGKCGSCGGTNLHCFPGLSVLFSSSSSKTNTSTKYQLYYLEKSDFYRYKNYKNKTK